MPSPMTPIAERTALSQPNNPDLFNRAFLIALLQGIANRGEWASKLLLDIKYSLVGPGDDYTSTSFGTMVGATTLTFTDVKVGDKILLLAHGTFAMSTFTADGTDPWIDLRWLIGGATDVYAAASSYPRIQWGSTIPASASDHRQGLAPAIHTVAADAASLTAALQARVRNAGDPPVATSGPVSLVGLHVRLGAA
jgi:hypothetical protein